MRRSAIIATAFWGASVMDTMIEVLITGATGFLGGCTAADLLDSDFAGLVLFLVRAPTPAEGLKRVRDSLRRFHVAEERLGQIGERQIICGDLTDVAAFAGDARLDRVTHVIHCAAIASFASHPLIRAVNVDGAFAFAQRMSRAPRLRRFLYVGTAMACGPNQAPPVAESYELAPEEAHIVPYTASKAEIERRLRAELPDLPLVVARPSIIVGHTRHGVRPSASIFWVFRMAVMLEKFTCDLDERIDVVPVDYCARALRELSFKDTLRHDLYHVSSGLRQSVTFGEFDAAYAKAAGAPPVGSRYRKIGLADIRAVAEEFRARLGDCNRRLVMRALKLYGGFAQLNYVFDNARLLAEGLPFPPRFTEYVHECVRTSAGVPLAEQMREDFK
jgi:nucleoside-diphosphate-sugar epimerase